jgi:hypothetical protein
MIIIIVLKSNSRVGIGQSLGQWSRPKPLVEVTRVDVRIKKIIVIV